MCCSCDWCSKMISCSATLPMPHLFLHLVEKHMHAFDHCKIPCWHLQVIFCLSLCPTMKLLGISFPTINPEFYGRFFLLFVDWQNGFLMSGITFMFWWHVICDIVDLAIIQIHKLLKPFNYCLTPQDMITGEGLLPYLDQTVSITVACLFHLQTIWLHGNRKNWNHGITICG